MAEGGTGCETSGGSRLLTSYEAVGGRQRFTLELRPGETTIVSWKKLLKDATTTNVPITPEPNSIDLTNGRGPAQLVQSAEQQPLPSLHPPSHPPLDARLAPVSDGEGPPVSRLNSVIERIERLYVGKASDDEEDLNDVVPDDDEYDTEDSFIDDTELDEYFQVDNSAIKHDGFFINRGKLERIEPAVLPDQQPKKRRRKDLAKDSGNDVGLRLNRHLKVGKKSGKSASYYGNHSTNLSHIVALPSLLPGDAKPRNEVIATKIPSENKTADTKSTYEVPPPGVPNGDPLIQEKEIIQQKLGSVPSKNYISKMKDGSEFCDRSIDMSVDKCSHGQEKSPSGRSLNNVDELNQSIQLREKSSSHERPVISLHEGKNSEQTAKVRLLLRKEGPNVRPRRTMLEKAIRDLEKLVSESRSPVLEVHDGDNSSQAVKRRLPPEIKQKIAKVARIAQASHGKITKEVINRLMSIVGHMIQLRSLKRNLKTMVNMGLSAKQDKDHMVQLTKKEVADMVRKRIPLMKSKAQEQLVGMSDNFQESNTEEKEAVKRKYSMDEALEDKLCDLYDRYIEGLNEDAGPRVRKLYAELATFWPSGFMDNHGVKHAICRAKDRRRSLQSRLKDQQKVKMKKLLVAKTEVTGRVEASSPAQPQRAPDKVVASGLTDHALSSGNKLISSNAAAATASAPVHVSYVGGSKTDRPKQEKLRGSSSNRCDTKGMDVMATKKVKRKPDSAVAETQLLPEKLTSMHGEGRLKSHKQVAVSRPTASLQLAPPSFQQQS